MSSHPGGSLWVDPEGVSSVGDAYAENADVYDGYHRRLENLRERYAPAWGNDSIGNQLKQPFDEVMDTVGTILTGVTGTLHYTANGLRGSGKAYRQADDDAGRAGHAIRAEFEQLPNQPANPPLERELVEGQPVELAARRVEGKLLLPRRELAERRPLEKLAERQPLQLERGLVEEERLAPGAAQPRHFLKSVAPVGLMTSAMALYPTGVQLDGAPVPAGYQLQKLTTLPDGTSRVDVNYYDAIVPLGPGHTVTGADGRPVDADGGQLFLVRLKDPGAVDATAPGYRPMVVSFSPDGTAVPVANPA